MSGMPTYEYVCPECGPFDMRQPITSDPITHCQCGSVVKRKIGRGSAVIFKGTGFYETDYKKKEKSNEQ